MAHLFRNIPKQQARLLRLAVSRWQLSYEIFSLLPAIITGILSGSVALAFWYCVGIIEKLFFGPGPGLLQQAAITPWWILLSVPTLGGLLVALLQRSWLSGSNLPGILDAIETAQSGRARPITTTLAGALGNILSLGTGSSSGREGPVVQLGAAIGLWLTRNMPQNQRLSMLGCGTAAAIGASFNAPLAGALFSLEVIVRSYRFNAFAPIVIASVAGTVVGRLIHGDNPAFTLPVYQIASAWEYPAFTLLGALSGLVAAAFVGGTELVRKILRPRLPCPNWLAPVIAGIIVGTTAIFLPEILGVGYGTTSAVISGQYTFWFLVALLVAKLITSSASIGFGFGSGVFSPSLLIGAILGYSFGLVATDVFPEFSSGPGVYALVGASAVAGSVLGAPISTIVIIFELYGDITTLVAVMAATVVSGVHYRIFLTGSIFARTLAERGLDPEESPELHRIRATPVSDMILTDTACLVGASLHTDELLSHLAEHPADTLFVTDEGTGKLVGAINLRELSVALRSVENRDVVTARDIMHPETVVTVQSDSIIDALKWMHDHRRQPPRWP